MYGRGDGLTIRLPDSSSPEAARNVIQSYCFKDFFHVINISYAWIFFVRGVGFFELSGKKANQVVFSYVKRKHS